MSEIQRVDLDDFEELAMASGVDPQRGYSGKGMFGAVCAAVAGQEADLVQFVLAAQERLPRALALLWSEPRKDTLGKRHVWYWPAIQTID